MNGAEQTGVDSDVPPIEAFGSSWGFRAGDELAQVLAAEQRYLNSSGSAVGRAGGSRTAASSSSSSSGSGRAAAASGQSAGSSMDPVLAQHMHLGNSDSLDDSQTQDPLLDGL